MLATESWEHHGKCPQKVKRVAETRLSGSLCTAKKLPMRNAGISADAVGHTLLSARSALRQLPQPPGWSHAGSSGRGTPGLGCTQHPHPHPRQGEMSRRRTGKGQKVRPEQLEAGRESACSGKGAQEGHGQATRNQCLQEALCVCLRQKSPGWAAGDGGAGVPYPHRAWPRGGVQKILDPPWKRRAWGELYCMARF